jgi:hypothetical protein
MSLRNSPIHYGADQRASAVCAAVANGIALGRDPGAPTHLVDFSSENVVSVDREVEEHGQSSGRGWRKRVPTTRRLLVRGQRRARRMRVAEAAPRSKFKGDRGCESRHVREALTYQAAISPIVARNPKDLFDEPHLADDFSEQLMEGWW